ncbi:PREDICTED: cyclin-dependent protein kinase inhibitor SMR3-like [Tarenaya hassleriana]|uniref:cyclin-dependent protein kinase inhibitor SMR3-like n=1 Tax=Tarenaya hassleriana TaxID=28532 RepID=UPI00053C4A1E|nr:PREDICTED: cyclin-dependent protein kinase inhibitor SMR3-like [Tarenaya hassleriana]
MAELCCVKEMEDDVETRLPTRPGLEIPADQEDPAVQNDRGNGGCKTPTSSGHKIPAMRKCPPAPRKPKPNRPVKRKLTSEKGNRVPIDLSREIELFFEDMDRRIKKSRRHEKGEGEY